MRIMTTYKVEGMTCGGCETSLTKAILAVQSDAKIEVDFKTGTLRVSGMDEATVSQVVEDAGFDFGGKA